MFEYPTEKYRFYTTTNKVIAVSTYEGKTVRGVAKCDPRDAFDMELGKQLAAARCNLKIAQKRARRAEKRFKEADERMKEAHAHVSKMNDYMFDAHKALRAADETVNKLLEKI